MDDTPLPKVKQVVDPKKELRPISLTASLSKVAEDFVVSDYIRPALERIADSNQFGTVSGSSTVLTLLSDPRVAPCNRRKQRICACFPLRLP